MKPHEITAAHEAERKEKRAALIKGIFDNVGGEILNSSNFGKRATEKMIDIDLKISESFGNTTVIFPGAYALKVGAMFCDLIQAHITDELEREGLQ
jgi:hypothetical protein